MNKLKNVIMARGQNKCVFAWENPKYVAEIIIHGF